MTVVITVGGTDVTADVIYETAHFESQVNAVAGSCQLRIRDLDRTQSYTPGEVITLAVDGDLVWYGFVGTVNRVYIAAALNIAEFGLARFIDIVGVDINILLTKRIVYKQSDPDTVLSPLYPPNTADITVIEDLIADWLDLSGDGLDTSTFVENVGDTIIAQSGRPWEGSDTWGQAMASIANIPAAIYYIDPDRNFVYTDTDTPNAPYGLSDQPNYSTTYGYREMEVLFDGSKLANDVMCWGIGYGSTVPVFRRDTDATSQATHGLWQFAQTTFGVYKQGTINRIAESIIDGSPENHRGAKDDRLAVMCVTFQPGFRPAHKIDFTSVAFGFNDVIPVRKMEVDFLGPVTPKYTLTLSHEIDTPFSFFDNLLLLLPDIDIPPPVLPAPKVCADCTVYLLVDLFDRTLVAAAGTSTSGATWTTVANPGGTDYGVNGASLFCGLAGGTFRVRTPTAAWPGGDTIEFSTRVSFYTTAVVNWPGFQFYVNDGSNTIGLTFDLNGTQWTILSGAGNFYPYTYPSVWKTYDYSVAPIWFGVKWRINMTSGAIEAKIWLETDGEPAAYQVSMPAALMGGVSGTTNFFIQVSSAVSGRAEYVDAIVVNYDRCAAVQFDNFQRTSTGSFGTATPSGVAWSLPFGAGSNVINVNNVGSVEMLAADGVIMRVPASPYWTQPDGFVMVYDFLTGSIPGTGDRVVTDIYDEDFKVDVFVAVSSDAANGEVSITHDDGSTYTAVVKTDWASGTWYRVEFEYRPGVLARVRVWPRTSLTPDWLIDEADTGGTALTGYLEFVPDNGTGSTYTMYYDNFDFDFTGRPCYIGGAFPAPGVPLNGYGCESQLSAGLPLVVLSNTYLANSTTVWVAGILQPQSDYTESPLTGTLTLDFNPSFGVEIRVCYYAV